MINFIPSQDAIMNSIVNSHIEQVKELLESKGWEKNKTNLSLKKGGKSIAFDKIENHIGKHFDINLFNSLDTSDDHLIGAIFCFDYQTKQPRPAEAIAQIVESSF